MHEPVDLSAVVGARTAAYGSFRRNAELTQQLVALTRGGVPISFALVEEHVHMSCHKTARMAVGGQTGDSMVDLRGYTRITCEELLSTDRWSCTANGLGRLWYRQTLERATRWDQLPHDIRDYLLSFLDALSMAVLSCTSQGYKAAMKEYCE